MSFPKMSLLLMITFVFAGVVSGQFYPIGDLNEDRRVDIDDLRMFVEQWLDERCLEPGCVADLNGSDGVNAVDYAILTENWGKESNLLISEFMASNGSNLPLDEGELVDKDGDSSDWIEIYNPTGTAISLGGLYLTDNEDDLDNWEFPDGVEIKPGAFFIVFASGKNLKGDELHTHFQLSADGGYLALVKEDGKTVVSEYDFPPQLKNISYGLRQLSSRFVGSGDTVFYHVPQVNDAEFGWMNPDFDDSGWNTATTGLGFVHVSGEVSDVTAPGNVVQGVPNDGDWPSNESPLLVIDDNLNTKYLHFKGDFDAGDPPGGAGFQVTPSIGPTVVTELTFTTANDAPERDPTALALYGSNDSIDGPYTLIAKGDIVDFSQASAWPRFTKNTTPISFSNNTVYLHYQLLFPAIRDKASSVAMQIGEVELLGCSATVAGSDIKEEMLDINTSLWVRSKFDLTAEDLETFDVLSLRMKYEDGFVAFLNGIEVARRNFSGMTLWNSYSDSDRASDSAEEFVSINISDYMHLLTSGRNVLAVQALNDNISDDDFYIQSELSAATSFGVSQYFSQTTPGAFNVYGAVDIVRDTKFSVDRGFYDTPFAIEITTETADATIHYTIDSSTPTEVKGLEYTGPIQITGTTCLRAMAFKPGWLSTNVDTQTYIFLDQVIRQPSNPADFPASWGSTAADYAMDQRVVNDPRYSSLMKDSLLSIPTMSIVTDLDNLFGPSGIYQNSTMEGAAWERPVSIELINPDGSTGFQIDAGLRTYGGAFRRMDLTRKKTFRLLFKRQYGAGKLNYRFFDSPDATTSFDTIILRAGANDGWNNWGGVNTQYIIDEFMRRTQLALGQSASHGRFVHLYVNGLYWGLYNPVERPEQSFAATYYEGDKDEWDAINAGELVGESSKTTWNAMLNQIRSGMGTIDAYQKIQGNNPDGTDNPGYDDLLDVENYVDYLFSNFWGGTGDWGGRNWYVACQKPPNATGFKFFNWDSEGAISIWSNLNANVTGVSEAIQEPYQGLRQNEDFRMLFADHAHRHLFNDGAATAEVSYARYKELSDEVELAIIAESARWGDQAEATLYTQSHWQAKRDYILNTYMSQRPGIVLEQLRVADLYPDVAAPEFKVDSTIQHGGYVDAGDELYMISLAGDSYINLVDKRQVWKYYDQGEGVPVSWKDRDFDDSGWKSGQAELGYGNTQTTEVGFGSNSSDKHVTTYFRHQFDIDDTLVYIGLELDVQRDDGVVVYLNGVELGRSNMPGITGDNNIFYDTAALSVVGGGDETSFFNIPVDNYAIDLLVKEGNVLAVEIHQHANPGQPVTSSDISFDLLFRAPVLEQASQNDIYYTVDGTDPRMAGGAVKPGAMSYSSPIVFTQSTEVKARAYNNGVWSALHGATYGVGQVKENLRVTEIMYHPADPNEEFIELKNIGDETLNLNMVRFTKGIDFDFGASEIAPGGYILLVSNQERFRERYPEFTGTIVGKYEGNLNNNIETIRLRDALHIIFQDFTYEDNWYEITDGGGFSLTIRDPYSTDPNSWDTKAGWRPSALFGGSPGYEDSGILPDPGAIVINEVLAHSHAADPDWIELHNTTDQPINIGDWYLSDSDTDDSNKMKYRIASGTTIEANGYIVFYENQTFGNLDDPGTIIPFALNEGGDTIQLQSTTDDILTGYEVSEKFGASSTGIAFGRHEKSQIDGGVNFVALSVNTPGSANTYPLVGPIVISEIMYNPGDGDTGNEYIELYNISGSDVTLADEVGTEIMPSIYRTDVVGWKFTGGINFEFNADTTIPAGGYLVIAKDPEAFKAFHGAMSAGVEVLGPFENETSLSNGGEKVVLSRPGDQELGEDRYYIRADQVNYNDKSPWPVEVDGLGKSMSQKTPDTFGANYGNDAANWEATDANPGL